MGANKPTFSGLSGIGDLLVTALSKHSRNRFVGEQIGLGNSVDEVTHSMDMVAEGINTCKAVPDLVRKYEVDMPISQSITDILFNGPVPRVGPPAIAGIEEPAATAPDRCHQAGGGQYQAAAGSWRNRFPAGLADRLRSGGKLGGVHPWGSVGAKHRVPAAGNGPQARGHVAK